MEFLGFEVKPGQSLKVEASEGKVVHLSQASLGEAEKDKGNGNGSIRLYVKIGDQKLVLGTLSADKFPQISYTLVFDKEFELSHTWKNGSIYVFGYRSPVVESYDKYPGNSEENKAKVDGAKPDAQKVNVDDDDSEDEDSDDDITYESDDSDGLDLVTEVFDLYGMELTIPGKGRLEDENQKPVESATKTTPGANKKAKFTSPQKTGGDNKKVGGHPATPYPSKGGQTPASGHKSKQTLKSPVYCTACGKKFNSYAAMRSHSKAKHRVAANKT